MLEQESQSSGWHQIVMTIYINRVTKLGRAALYFDGEKIGQNRLDGMYSVIDQHYASEVIVALYITDVLENWYHNGVSPPLRHPFTFHRYVVPFCQELQCTLS